MPRGKAQPKDSTVESTHSSHSSMRRLSSITSLHQLNPFSRSRRTLLSDDDLASDITSDATSTVEPSPSDANTKTRALQEISHNVRPAPPHAFGGFLRKSNYTSLPDENHGGLPRSKTFSSLPLPVKSRKRQTKTTQDTLTEEPSLVADSREPTPPISTRRYLFGNTSARFGIGAKLTRSDTEPLLVNVDTQHSGSDLLLKENVPGVWKRSAASQAILDLESDLVATESLTKPPKLERRRYDPVAQSSSSEAMPTSSPATKSKPSSLLPPLSTTKSQGSLAQRWKSQPNLYTHVPKRSTRRLGTPPPASLPSFADEITRSLIGASPYAVPPLEKFDEEEERGRRLVRDTTPQPHSRGTVIIAQPPAYWAGRLSTLLDRAKIEETKKFFADLHDDLSLKYDSDKVYDEAMNIPRIRTAFESLYNCCVTHEAKDSFVVFQLQYAALRNEPELAIPIRWAARPTPWPRHSEVSKVSSDISAPSSSARSVSFVNRLLGRGKRSSIAS